MLKYFLYFNFKKVKQESFFDLKDRFLYSKSSGEQLPLDCVFNFDACVLADESKISDLFLADGKFSGASLGGVTADADFVVRVAVAFQTVMLADGGFDESFLANLRTFLKKLEAAGGWAVIAFAESAENCASDKNCVTDANSCDSAISEIAIAAISHTARRVKDCAAVIGVEIPENFSDADITALKTELHRKHQHYFYFSWDGGKFYLA